MVVAEAIQFSGWEAFTILVFVLGFLGALLAVTVLVGVSLGIWIGRAADARDGVPAGAARPRGSRLLLVVGGMAGAIVGWIVGWNLEVTGDPLGDAAPFTVFLPGPVLPVVWGFLYGAPRSFAGNRARPGLPPPPDPPREEP